MNIIKGILICLTGLSFYPGRTEALEFTAVQTAFIQTNKIKEGSGMAASRNCPGCLWLINDSGAKAELHLLTRKGKKRSTYRLIDAENRDWEDMAQFEWHGESCLAIADVGDNRANHDLCRIFFVKEPSRTQLLKSGKMKIRSLGTLEFVYEDGPRDCEGIAVDTAAQCIWLVSKRTVPPVLYRLPLILDSETVQTAKVAAPLKGIPRPTMDDILADRKYGKFCSQITGLDLKENRLYVLSYRRLFVYQRKNGEPWSKAVGRKPEIFIFPALKQAEAVCVTPENRDVLITSEGKNAPVLKIKISE